MGFWRNFATNVNLGAAQGYTDYQQQEEENRQQSRALDLQAFQTAAQVGDTAGMTAIASRNPWMKNQLGQLQQSYGVQAQDEVQQAQDTVDALDRDLATANTQEEATRLEQQRNEAMAKLTTAQRKVSRFKPGTTFAAPAASSYQQTRQRLGAQQAGGELAAQGLQAIQLGAPGVDVAKSAADLLRFQHPELSPEQLNTLTPTFTAILQGQYNYARKQHELEERVKNAQLAVTTAQMEHLKNTETREQREDFLRNPLIYGDKAKTIADGLGYDPRYVDVYPSLQAVLSGDDPNAYQQAIDLWQQSGGKEGDSISNYLRLRQGMTKGELRRDVILEGMKSQLKMIDFSSPNGPKQYQELMKGTMDALDQAVQSSVTGRLDNTGGQLYLANAQRAAQTNNLVQLKGIYGQVQGDKTLDENTRQSLLEQLQQLMPGTDLSGQGPALPFMERFGGAIGGFLGTPVNVGSGNSPVANFGRGIYQGITGQPNGQGK